MFVSTFVVLATLALSALGQYEMVHQTSTWAEANEYCSTTFGTTLATIKNDDDANTLLTMRQNLGSYRVWIGQNYEASEGGWHWASGYECDGECEDLEWWNSGEPNGGGGSENCAEIRHQATSIDSMLNDIPCAYSDVHYFACDGPTLTGEPTTVPTENPTINCAALHIDEFLVSCSAEFDGHDDRIEGHDDRISSIESAASSIDSQLDEHSQSINELEATVNGLVNATNAMTAEMRVLLEHLDILGDYQVESGWTQPGPMPLDMSDYVLYALAAIDLIVLMGLIIYCVFVRTTTSPKYGKVAIYETERD